MNTSIKKETQHIRGVFLYPQILKKIILGGGVTFSVSMCCFCADSLLTPINSTKLRNTLTKR